MLGLTKCHSGQPVNKIEFSRRCMDGSTGYHTFSANPVIEDGRIVGLEGFLIDITEQKHKEEELQRNQKLLDSVRDAQSLFISQGDPREAYGALLKILVEMTGSEYGFLDDVLWDEQGKEYKRSLAISDIAWDEDSRRIFEQLKASNWEFRELHNLAGLPALTGQLIISNEVSKDTRSRGIPKGHPALVSFMGMPLYFGGRTVGVAGVANRPGGYTEDIARFMEPFNATCASIIHAARQREKEAHFRNTIDDHARWYAAIQSTTADGFWLLDMSGRILEVNDRYCQWTGYSREEMLSLRVFDVELNEDEAATKRHIETLIKKGFERFETRHRTKEGSAIELEISTSYLPERQCIIVFLRDIRTRKRILKELRANEEKFRSVLDWTYDWEYWIDQNHSIQYMSPSVQRITGYPPEAFIDYPGLLNRIVHPEDRLAWDEHLQCRKAKRDEEGAMLLEHRIIAEDGRIHWLQHSCRKLTDADGKFLGFRVSNRDITDWKEIEDRQREDAVRLKMAIAAANVGLWNWDLTANTIFYSPEWKRQIGYEDHEISNDFSEWESRVHPDDLNRCLTTIRAFVENPWPGYHLEFRFRHKDGSYRWILTQASIIHDDTGKPVRMIGSHVDITEQKKLEEQIRLQAMVLEQIQDQVTVTDLEGRITFVNDAEVQVLGRPRDKLIGSSVESYGEDPARGATQREIIQKTRGDGAWRGEVVNYARDGREIILDCRTSLVRDAKGEAVAMCGIATDITDLKKTQQTIERQHAELQAVYDSAPIMMCLLDRERNILYANHAFETFAGTCTEALKRGRACGILGCINALEDPRGCGYGSNCASCALRLAISETFQTGIGNASIEHSLTLRRDNQDRVVFLLGATALVKTAGEPRLLLCLQDITERKTLEQREKEHQQHLFQTAKMASLGVLVAGVAHEINNPNFLIMLNTSVLKDVWNRMQPILEQYFLEHGDFAIAGGPYSHMKEEIPQMISSVLEGSERIKRIVQELRNFARKPDKDVTELVDLNTVIQSALVLLANMIKKATNHLEVHGMPELPKVWGNAQHMEQVIINLVQNACQALTSKDQKIALTTYANSDENTVVLEVRDEGM